jgi:murein DD-endopeptidase MepM/ murein hydrolase activator NlpD
VKTKLKQVLIGFIYLTVTMFVLLPSSTVLALSSDAYDSLYGDTVWYDPNSGSCASPSPGAASASDIVWPFVTKSESQYNRVDQGWDIQDKPGAAIYAIAPGTIHVFNPNSGGFGNDYPTEKLDTTIGGPTDWVYYGHVHVLPSVINKHVNAGQQIAVANKTDPENGSAAPPGWLEIGFARPNTDAPVGSGGGLEAFTPEGQKMKDILLMAKPGTNSVDSSTESTSSACCASSFLTGSDNNAKAFIFLRSKGLSALESAAVVGNFIVESGQDPITPTGTNPGTHAFGIGQWLGGRLTALQQYAQKPGNSLNSLQTQLNYLWDVDLPSQEPSFHVLAQLRAAPTLAAKAVSWEATFERSGGALLPERISKSQEILSKYGSLSPSSSEPSDSAACSLSSSDSVNGDYSLPVAKKWYTQHPDWFTSPHHDYPADDIPVPTGTPVFSMTSGKIVSITLDSGCGNGVFIDAGNGIEFGYCHSSDAGSINGARVGDTVKAGQLIFHSDNSGDSTGPHVHVQIKINGRPYCPQSLMTGIATGSIPNIKSLPTTGCYY